MLTSLAALALAASPTQAAAERARFSFVVAGHIRGDRNGEIPPGVEELVVEIERLSPDLVFLTGDLIWGDILREGPRTDADTLIYRFTVTDPTTWTKPWTAEVPMTRSNDQMLPLQPAIHGVPSAASARSSGSSSSRKSCGPWASWPAVSRTT